MGKIKADDKSSISGNSCKTEVKCKEENALSSVSSSVLKKKRSDYMSLPKNNLSDDKFNLHSVKDKRAGMSRTREKGTRNSSCVLGKVMKDKVAENEKEIFTTKAKERSSSIVSCSSSKSKSQVASSKRRINDALFQPCSDEEQPTSKRLKRFERPIPTVHIQRLNNTEPVLFSVFDKYDNEERKSAETASTKTIATDLSEGYSKNCQLLDPRDFREVSVKAETDCRSSLEADGQKPETFEVKQEYDCNDVQLADVAVAKHVNEKTSSALIPFSMKFDEELKSATAKQFSSISKESCNADCCEGLTEDTHCSETVKNAASDDSSCDVVLLADSSRTKTRRRSRSDIPRKRTESDDITCPLSTPIKLEPGVEDSVATAVISMHETSKVDVREFVHDSPDKTARTSGKNAGAKAVKKTRPTKSKQSSFAGSSVSPSILTRSMIKIPG